MRREPKARLKQRKNGVWYAELYWPSTRARRYVSLRTRDEAEAQRLFDEVEQDLVSAAEPPGHSQRAARKQEIGPDPRIGELIDWYVDAHLPFLGRAEGTVRKYRKVLQYFQQYCRQARIERLSQMDWEAVADWIAWMTDRSGSLGPKSRADRITILRTCFNAAVNTDRIERSPVKRWHVPQVPEQERRRLTVKERDELLGLVLNHAPDLYGPIAYMAFSGQSPVDVINLKRSQVHLDLSEVTRLRVKVGRLKTYPISGRMRKVLEREYERHPSGEYVFLTDAGKPWTYSQLSKRLRRVQEQHGAGPPTRCKDLRTTFATLMAYAGCPVALLQRFMGHNNIKTTLMFYQQFGKEEAQAWIDRLP